MCGGERILVPLALRIRVIINIDDRGINGHRCKLCLNNEKARSKYDRAFSLLRLICDMGSIPIQITWFVGVTVTSATTEIGS